MVKEKSQKLRTNPELALPPEGYREWLKDIKERIRTAQQKVVLASNSELIVLYWQIGREILERQKQRRWGAKVVDRLADDLRREFPSMKGFSRANLLYMRSFAESWQDSNIVQQLVGQIPWGHNIALLTKVKNNTERSWYARAIIENGWSRAVLIHQIESRLFQRQGKAITNFHKYLPGAQSELAQQTLKDPYMFDFLGIGKEAHERDIECC